MKLVSKMVDYNANKQELSRLPDDKLKVNECEELYSLTFETIIKLVNKFFMILFFT
jgi:hypothetical protein